MASANTSGVSKSGGAKSAIADAFDQAQPVEDRKGGGGDRGGGQRHSLPTGCPIEPLGTENGVFFYLDPLGQLRDLKPREHGRSDLAALFLSRIPYLKEHWPRVNAKGMTVGWRPEEVQEALMQAAAAKGVWNPRERVRGRGAWLGDDGGLVLHCGDHILIGGKWQKPGLHGDHVYPTAPAGPRPHVDRADMSVAQGLLSLFSTWAWRRPRVDPWLLLGWVAAGMIGGALTWRPMAWITGDKATGKSTLQEIIRHLMGGGLLSTSDTTEAAIRQILGQQTYPVAIDEAEAEEDNRRNNALIKLARQASSGGAIFRGGQDHQGHEFTARSAFLFSSILLPPMQGQDKSRLAVLELDPLPRGAPPPRVVPGELKELGTQLRRRLLDQWPRFAATLHDYQTVLVQNGHGGRSADQFGTLLACADLLLFDGPPDEDMLMEWGERLAASALAEKAEDISDSDRCVVHLATTPVMLAGGGTQRTIAEWITQALDPEPDASNRADKHLQTIGLRIVRYQPKDESGADAGPEEHMLAVAGAHQGLAKVFQDTHWATRSGATGTWSQSLRRIDGAVPNRPIRFAGVVVKSTLVPIGRVVAQGAEA